MKAEAAKKKRVSWARRGNFKGTLVIMQPSKDSKQIIIRRNCVENKVVVDEKIKKNIKKSKF